MVQSVLIRVGVLILIFGLTVAPVAGPITTASAQTAETEPNDDFETADRVGEVNISAEIGGGESDFYQINANTTEALSLEVSNMTGGAAVEIRLYDSDRDELETDFRNRNGDLSITRKLPETGTYYVEIDGTGSQTTTEYTLDIDRVTPSENDQFAPNDGFTSAATIPEGFNDARIVGGESDFYQINANTTDALSLEVSNMRRGAAVEIRLYNSDRDELETDFRNRGADLSITRKLPETGTYYVEIDGTGSQTTTEYTLDIDRVTPSENDQFAPNDGFTSAATIPEGFSDARIVGGESDFYQINANTTDALSLEVSNMVRGAAVEIRLYDSDRDELETDFRNRGADLSITRKLPETGTYYVEIDGTGSQTTTEYTLDIDRVTPSENDQFAPNDGFTSAATITKEFSDARIVGGESDFYQINANTTEALSLEVSNMVRGAAVEIRLYNSDRDELETDFRNRGADLSIARKLPETGTYYVEIDGTGSQTTTEYTLQSSQTGEFPNPDSQPELSATVQQAGSPGGQARVQYTLSNVSGQSSVAIEFTNLPSQVSVNTSASTTTGTFGSNAQRVLFSQPNSEGTATVAFEIPATASADATFDIEAAALNENDTATDTVTTTVRIVEQNLPGAVRPNVTAVSQPSGSVSANSSFEIDYRITNPDEAPTAFTFTVPTTSANLSVAGFAGEIQGPNPDGTPPSTSTTAVDPGQTASVTVTYRVAANATGTGNVTVEASAAFLNSTGAATTTVELGEPAVPATPRERALQVAGVEDPAAISQRDITVAITLRDRGRAANGVNLTQTDITTLITLRDRARES